MQLFLDGEYYRKHIEYYTLEGICNMFHCSTSGYYSWFNRTNDKAAQEAKAKELNDLKSKVITVIQRLHYVPGKRLLKLELERRFDIQISVKKCRDLMRQMRLTPNKPKKDPYKHQATHDHEYAAPADNLLDRRFYIGPRKVILTDITYLVYSQSHKVAYLCVFRDAFTKELLGWHIAETMSVEGLVRPAYDMMMKNHGHELKDPDIFVHSDQGSQYMSTTFQQLLKDDNFIQSVSGRGNSWDNSPMESFFGYMKTRIMDILALAPDFETARDLTNGYIVQYNEKDFQYDLAGLTPVEFYMYLTTGVYPCESYFGVDGSRLDTPEKLAEQRRLKAAERAEKARKRDAERKASGISYMGKEPEKVVQRDIRLLEQELKGIEKDKKALDEQHAFIEEVIKKAESALAYVNSVSPDVKEALRTRKAWHLHPQMSYIFDMKGMF